MILLCIVPADKILAGASALSNMAPCMHYAENACTHKVCPLEFWVVITFMACKGGKEDRVKVNEITRTI